MPNIEIPDEQFQRLTVIARGAGYPDVSAFIASFIDQPFEDPRSDLTDAQLQSNVDAMERGEAEIEAGGGQDMQEAIFEIANKYGLNIAR